MLGCCVYSIIPSKQRFISGSSQRAQIPDQSNLVFTVADNIRRPHPAQTPSDKNSTSVAAGDRDTAAAGVCGGTDVVQVKLREDSGPQGDADSATRSGEAAAGTSDRSSVGIVPKPVLMLSSDAEQSHHRSRGRGRSQDLLPQ